MRSIWVHFTFHIKTSLFISWRILVSQQPKKTIIHDILQKNQNFRTQPISVFRDESPFIWLRVWAYQITSHLSLSLSPANSLHLLWLFLFPDIYSPLFSSHTNYNYKLIKPIFFLGLLLLYRYFLQFSDLISYKESIFCFFCCCCLWFCMFLMLPFD